MPLRKNITLYEGNIETIALVVTTEDDGLAQDLTFATVEVYLKPNKDTDDGDASVVLLSTETGEVVKTTPLDGEATITFPSDLSAGTLWWRVDVIINNRRKTAVYGSLYVENI